MRMENKRMGKSIYELCSKIYPICRSITGDGVRRTIDIMNEFIDVSGAVLNTFEVPTGTKAYDWVIPEEWNIRGGYIETLDGKRIVDFNENNLHVMGYSVPVDTNMKLAELKDCIYTQKNQPDAIPYVTSYYNKRFGFCMSENKKNNLKDDTYHVVIDSELKQGSLTYAECFLEGESDKEIFVSTYICHPSMANDNCSGLALMAGLICRVAELKRRRYSYRFVVLPETIGALAYLSQDNHLELLKRNVAAGFNLSCVGDDNDYTIIKSRNGKTLADRVLANVLMDTGRYKEYSYLDRGSDERQYCAPGVDLPLVCFCRSKFGTFPEYHTSLDNMNFVSEKGFEGSFAVMGNVFDVLEINRVYKCSTIGEPQLGRRGLYPTISQKGNYDEVFPMRNFISYADGTMDLIDISERINCPISKLEQIIPKLVDGGIIGVAEKEGN